MREFPISKFWLTGRLQGEYHSFDNDVSGDDHDGYDGEGFRFAFKATLLGDITLHSEADLGLENSRQAPIQQSYRYLFLMVH